MAGLLDFLNTAEAQAGLGLLAAAGPRSDGAGFGQRMIEGLGQADRWKAQQAAAKRAEMQDQMAQMQMAQQQQRLAMEQDAMKRQATDESAVRGAVASGQFDPRMFLQGNPQASLGALKQAMEYNSMLNPEPKERTLSPGQVVYKGDKQILAVPKESELPTSVREFQYGMANPDFNNWQLAQKKAGATNVTTKIENKMGEGLAAQVGPMVKDTYQAAQGAVQQIDAAKRIVQAVDSGKIIAGPLAGGRLKVAQVGQMLGVSGKDDAETIANTRQVIRGLSEMTLQGRKQMTGQGAITESEGKLAEKANSGDIADLTPAEIRQLANASARASKFIYGQHQQNLQELQSNPGTAGLSKFYRVAPMPDFNFEQPAPVQSPGWSIKPVGGK